MPDFLHVDTYSWKLKADLKIWGRGEEGGCGQKWVWPLCSWDSKIGYISRRN